jgi:hypothetical protein
MKTYQIDNDVLKDFEELKIEANKLLKVPSGQSVGYNNVLLLQKIKEKKSGIFVQCGVFRGWTLIPAILYCRKHNYDFEFYGFDTFYGFPDNVTSNQNDEPTKFIELFDKGLITEDHYNKAKIRTNNFEGIDHLETDYFSNVENVLSFKKYFDGTKLFFRSGVFSSSLPQFKEEIDILHLDCDLYQSYLDVLNSVYKNVKKGGSVIFDEYYSLKYPGARIAVDEFFKDNTTGHFEKYITEDSFERWCFER